MSTRRLKISFTISVPLTSSSSVKEIPFEQHEEVYAWAARLSAGEFDLTIMMTGTGLAFLRDILAERYPPEMFTAALRGTTTA